MISRMDVSALRCSIRGLRTACFIHCWRLVSCAPTTERKTTLLAVSDPESVIHGSPLESIFHHFPITRRFVVCKCRQFSVLGLTRGSLGSFYTAIVRRPLRLLALTILEQLF